MHVAPSNLGFDDPVPEAPGPGTNSGVPTAGRAGEGQMEVEHRALEHMALPPSPWPEGADLGSKAQNQKQL